jgi:hypothetical protein
VLDLLQNRRFAVLERLILVGRVCGKWSELEASPAAEERQLEFLENFSHAPRGHLDATRLELPTANPASKLAIVLDLLAARIHLDHSPARYLDLYREFVNGLQLEPGRTLDSAVKSYLAAYESYYAPFMRENEHMLGHDLGAMRLQRCFRLGFRP